MNKLIIIYRNVIGSVKKDVFLKSVAVLSSGIGLAQLIVMAASPLLTRLYEPKDFGILSAFGAALGLGLIVASWRYERAIPIVKSKRSVIIIIWLCILALICNTVLLSFFLLWLSEENLAIFKIPEVVDYLWLLPLGVLLGGFYEMMTYVAVRNENYSLLAKTKVAQGGWQVVTQIGLGLAGLCSIGLIVGDVIGRSLGGYTLLQVLSSDWKFRPKRYYFSHIRVVAKRLWQFPLISMPTGVLNRAGTMAPQLLFVALYDAGVAGLLFFAQQIILGPLLFIGRSVSKVFLGHISNTHRNSLTEIVSIIDKTVLRLFAIGFVPIALLAWLGPVFFGFVFGENWAEAGVYARYLAIPLLIQFAIAPVLQTLIVLERLVTLAFIDAIRLFLIVGVIVVMHSADANASEAIIGYSVSLSATYLVSFIIVRQSVKII
jgi:O-antigen/teichoic acid export membrane protein